MLHLLFVSLGRRKAAGFAPGLVLGAALAPLTAAACAILLGCGPGFAAQKSNPPASAAAPRKPTPGDLEAARELDQQGARLFVDGRYQDAMTYFRAAFERGAPPIELWNIAKCQQKLDDAEGAEGTLEQYIAREDVSAGDRAEARRELAELRARTSRLTVVSQPPRAIVYVNDKRIGRAPVTLDLAPGDHAVRLEADGHRPVRHVVRARLGRSVLAQWELPRR
jgi:hypothetical protein